MPTAVDLDDTLGQRSILRNLSNTGYMNDDEAERAQRRRTLGKSPASSAILSNERLDEEQQGLKKCLQIYHDNKISKDNAWQLTLIDNMANLCRGHHKTLKNFQIVGTSLEATTKIYGLRVDSVHSDVVRMSSGLGRMKNDKPRHDDEEDDGGDHQNDNGDHLNENGEPNQAKAPAKKKRVKKMISTITKNKDTLNGRLELMQTPDALFYKLNSIMGETSSSNKMILNMLETKRSQMSITMHEPFWETHTYEQIVFDENDNYDLYEADCSDFPMKPHIGPQCTLRQQMSGYAVTNTPIDDDVEEEVPHQVADASFNISQYEYAFDMAADIEPIPAPETYGIDYDHLDCDGGNDFDDLTQDDRDAINACKGLRRKATLIQDMRPVNGTKLEYSYRPLDNINQFWAGPSYWKIRPKSRKLTMGGRPSFADSDAASSQASSIATHTIKRKVTNRSKAEKIRFVSMINNVPDDSRDISEDEDDAYMSIESKVAQKFKKTNVYKRWDSKRLKLPTDLQIDRGLFGYYEYCPSVVIHKPDIDSATPIDDGDVYDTDIDDEPHDNGDMMMDHDMDNGMEMDHMNDLPEIDANIPFSQASSQIPDSQFTQAEGEISHHYEGAPQEIKKIDIQFARRAKVIDMKQMKSVCLNTISRQCEKTSNRTITHPDARTEEKYKDGAASFGIIYNTLPHLLTKTMAENLSPSIAFYSILHLANEHRFRLYKSTKEDELNIFLIRQLD